MLSIDIIIININKLIRMNLFIKKNIRYIYVYIIPFILVGIFSGIKKNPIAGLIFDFSIQRVLPVKCR